MRVLVLLMLLVSSAFGASVVLTEHEQAAANQMAIQCKEAGGCVVMTAGDYKEIVNYIAVLEQLAAAEKKCI